MPLITPWRQVLCPFCFKEFHISEAPLRPLGNERPEPDAKLGEFFGTTAMDVPKIKEPPQRGWASQFWLDNGPMRDHDRVCPHCHMPLPVALATGQLDSRIIAVFGERASGKSAFFGVLVRLLTTGQLALDAGFGVVGQPVFDRDTRNKVPSSAVYQQRYGQYLDEEPPRVPPVTPPISVNSEWRVPLIYRLQAYHRDRQGRQTVPPRITQAIDLVLFDTSGETVEQDNVAIQTYQYLTKAAGIIVLVNPLRLQGVRRQLPAEWRDRIDEPALINNVLDSFFNLFDRDPRYGVRKSIDIPVAVALTKTDVLDPLLDAGSQILKTPQHRGGFDAEDAERVSIEVRGYLDRWAGGAVTTNLNRLKRPGYFAISSFGCRPNDDETIPAFSPRRVADPLFWILHQLGFLPAIRRSPVGGGPS